MPGVYNRIMRIAQEKKRDKFSRWFRLCPVRHCLALLGAGLVGAYFAFQGDERLMKTVEDTIAQPYFRAAGEICSIAKFSVAEMIYAIGITALLIYLIVQILNIVHKPEKKKCAYRTVMTFLTTALVFYGLFCILWGVYYKTADFSEASGLRDEPVSTDELYKVTAYFADMVNTYAGQTQRDENGLFQAHIKELFDQSATLYEPIVKKYPCLEGPSLRAKPLIFSKIMSLINFTGYFFPITGEANLNTDAPLCLLPATIAHELAHQRGVAKEDQANFVAVIACLASEKPDFCYSGCLLAYIHLENALSRADPVLAKEIRQKLSDNVKADLTADSKYWQAYETTAAKVSESVYSKFLTGYGEKRGLESYGACVDLLAAYYYDTATAKSGVG
jgi:hypothetical protein